jgi:hypothetical protein
MKTLIIAISLLTNIFPSPTAAPKQEFYALRIYQLATAQQESRVDSYLKETFLPALHHQGIRDVGVFKPVGNDTAAVRRIYLLIPFKNLEQFAGLGPALSKDPDYTTRGLDYQDARYDSTAYTRMETILLEAFPDMPQHAVPTALQGPRSERVYELRSYESPSEKYFASKVHMFNEGGEIPLFRRLGFNAVFYASVLSGGHMPNLMYMTSFDNMASREQHWKTFSADPAWKQLSSSPQYQHNVSHIDIVFLHPAEYSDL